MALGDAGGNGPLPVRNGDPLKLAVRNLGFEDIFSPKFGTRFRLVLA
jgi:hypothetical protein